MWCGKQSLMRIIYHLKLFVFFFNIGVFPLEFDEDDPLAGLLSDEEDDLASKPKPKKTSTPKNTRSSVVYSFPRR